MDASAATRSERGGVSSNPYPPARQAWTMVALLTVANILSFVDRQIISLLVDPIRADLGISDIQVSLLIGPTFAIFFCLMALPIGRLVDTRHRIRVAAIGIGLWSLATFLSGYADSFSHLFLARIGVAVGEAALFPAANSLIADSFPPGRRARAIGVFALAIYLGSGLALLFGGAVVGLAESGALLGYTPSWLTGFRSWQLVLLAVGAPGLVVALLILLLPEPARRSLLAAGDASATSFGANMRAIFRRGRLFFGHFLSFSMFVLSGYAVLGWAPTHLVRNMGLTRANAGLWLGIAVIAGGLVGIGMGTTLADRLAVRGVLDGKVRIGAVACGVGAVLQLIAGRVDNPGLYVSIIGLTTVCSSAGIALGPAALQEIAPGEMRGQSLAAYQLVATIVGAGLGPPLVALIAKSAGVEIGVALAIVAAVSLALGAAGFLAVRQRFGDAARALAAAA